MKAVVCCTPPARLVTRSGVTLAEALTVSIWLAHGSITDPRSAFTGERPVPSARNQNGYATSTWPNCAGIPTCVFDARSYTISEAIATP